MYLYMNGEFIDENEAKISPFDHGYLYGLGVFETFRTYNGYPFLLTEHMARLNYGLEQMNIHKRFQAMEVLDIIQELSRLNQLPNSYIRFNVSAGNGEVGLQTDHYEEPTIIMFQKPLPMQTGLQEKEAILLKLNRNTPETAQRLKSHHFLNNVAAKREVGNVPHMEGIFLTKEGYVAEGVTSNLFWVKNEILYTPDLATGILNGVTRQLIIQLAMELNVNVNIGFFSKHHLFDADEIFITNSIQEIVPVNKLERFIFPGKSGPFIQKLNKKYQEKISLMQQTYRKSGEL